MLCVPVTTLRIYILLAGANIPKIVALGLIQEAFYLLMTPETSKDAVRSPLNHARGTTPTGFNPQAGYTHLVVVCHGVMGRPGHVANLCEAIRASLGIKALVLAPACCTGFATLAGTQACGNAVFAELQAAAATHKPTLTHVSLLGTSRAAVIALICRSV